MRVILLAATAVQNRTPNYEFNYPAGTSADELAEMAGRLCYLSEGRPNPDTATNAGYLSNIIVQRHFSVLEHASVTFYIDGVTRNFTHELIRHRHLSFSEVSQRYVDISEFPFIEHPGLKNTRPMIKPGGRTKIDSLVDIAKATYRDLMDELTGKGYKRKEARQAARHVLPGGMETKIVVTGNMRAWREMLEKRLSPAADAEFREVATKILQELRVIAPNTFQDFE